MNNPLLEIKSLPEFSQIKPNLIRPAIEEIISDNRKSLEQLIAQPKTDWGNLLDPLALMEDKLNKAWSPVRHLNSVKSSDALREAYNGCLSLLSDYSTEISQNRKLYERVKEIADAEGFIELDAAQQKAVKDSLKHFRLGGVDLEGQARERYQQLQKGLSEHQSNFENNLLDASQSWQLLISDEAMFAGLPNYALSMLKQLAEQRNLPDYRVTLDMPCYIAVITYADDRDLRRQIFEAYVTRASDVGVTDKKWDNSGNMVNIVAKRLEKAQLLGFRSYAEYSLETKMAGSVEEVIAFLEDLAERSKKAAIDEVAERQAFAESLGFEGELQAWDYAYYSEKLKQRKYQISEEDLKPYFSDELVINGLFDIVKNLYRVDIVRLENGIDLWDPSVRFYQISNEQGETIGQFYLDLYARENKRGGAWINHRTLIGLQRKVFSLRKPTCRRPGVVRAGRR